MSNFDRLKLEQIDEALKPFKAASDVHMPRRGWVRAVRNVLGMSARQLAERMDVSQSTVANLERSEVEGTITLASLRRLAQGLECRLVYGLVPLEGSLQATLHNRAERVARGMVESASISMALEKQAIPKADRDRQVEELTMELAGKPRKLWDDGDAA